MVQSLPHRVYQHFLSEFPIKSGFFLSFRDPLALQLTSLQKPSSQEMVRSLETDLFQKCCPDPEDKTEMLWIIHSGFDLVRRLNLANDWFQWNLAKYQMIYHPKSFF